MFHLPREGNVVYRIIMYYHYDIYCDIVYYSSLSIPRMRMLRTIRHQ